ncbi:MAG TPA: hypothetical protein VIB79_09600 [Candidatus Binatia bacterium]
MSRVFTPSEVRDAVTGAQTRVSARALPVLAVVLAIGVFSCLTVGSILENSPTIDEPIHLLAGYSYIKWQDYRVNPEHPPLAKMFGALPLLALDVKDPRPSSADWSEIPGRRPGIPAGRVALQFFFADNDAETLFFYGKLPFVLLGAILALAIFFWSEERFGIAAAAAALILFVTNPTILAHSTVIHTDIAFSLCFFVGTYFFHKSLGSGGWVNGFLACLIFAVAAVTKFSAVGIFLSWLVIGLWWCFGKEKFAARSTTSEKKVFFGFASASAETTSYPAGPPGQVPRRLIFLMTLLAAAGLTAFVMVWAVYGFRFTAIPGGGTGFSFNTVWAPSIPQLVKAAALAAIRYHLLPEAWIYGQLYNFAFIHRGSFLLGHFSDHGFWSYFPIALAVKTPLPALILIVLAMADVFRRGTWKNLETYSLLIPIAVYFALAVSARMNIGVRHILPIFPFLFVLAGASGARLLTGPRRWTKCAIIFLFGWACWNTWASYPNYFSFFNEVAGGSKGGSRILLDSNVDWGQDLKRLKIWLDEHGIKKTLLVYFGMAEPAYYGIDAVQLPGGVFPPHLAPIRASDELPYTLAISANHLYAPGIYSMPPEQAFVESFHLTTPDAVVGDAMMIFQLDPADAQVNLSLGSILALNGEVALAKKALEKISPESHLAPAARDLLGRIERRQ